MQDLLKPCELARLCGVSPDTVRGWCNRKHIKFASTPGGHKRFQREDVLEFLKSHGFPIPKAGKLAPVRVLVIDDDDAFRNSLVAALQKAIVFNVKEAADGYEAGKMIRMFAPDVVILDLVMPGIDGIKVCQDIRSAYKTAEIKIIVVTGFPDEEMFQKALNAGADVCLAKPVDVERLINLIHGEYRSSGKPKKVISKGSR